MQFGRKLRRRQDLVWRWYASPDGPFLAWIALELVSVAVAVSVVEYLAGWRFVLGTLLTAWVPALRHVPPLPLPLPGLIAVALFGGLLYLQPRLWPWPTWRLPLWGALVLGYGLLSWWASAFLLLVTLISSYGIVAYARVTRTRSESRRTLGMLLGAVAVGCMLGRHVTALEFGIWLLGALFVQTFTGLGLREREARQQSEALVAELRLAQEQVRLAAAQAIETAALRERERLARELHDTLVQGVVAIIMHLEAAHELLDTQPDVARPLVDRAHTLARTTLSESRAAMLALAVATPLAERLAYLRRSTAAEVTVTGTEGLSNLPALLTEVCWRVCQEAVRNAARHGQAQHIAIHFRQTPAMLAFQITDDGRGFDNAALPPLSAQGGFGLAVMRQRATEGGGTCVITSEVGQGTQVTVTLPLAEGAVR